MILSNFKPKKSPFLPFFLEKLSKIPKIGDFGCKNNQNLKKIQRSIFIPLCCKSIIMQHCALPTQVRHFKQRYKDTARAPYLRFVTKSLPMCFLSFQQYLVGGCKIRLSLRVPNLLNNISEKSISSRNLQYIIRFRAGDTQGLFIISCDCFFEKCTK